MKNFDELEPYQKRVVVEMEELLDKVEALEAFYTLRKIYQCGKYSSVPSTAASFNHDSLSTCINC